MTVSLVPAALRQLASILACCHILPDALEELAGSLGLSGAEPCLGLEGSPWLGASFLVDAFAVVPSCCTLCPGATRPKDWLWALGLS